LQEVRHAQFRSSDAEVVAAKARLTSATSVPPSPNEDISASPALVAASTKVIVPQGKSKSTASLPPMRKAAN